MGHSEQECYSMTTEQEHYHFCEECGSGWGCRDETCEVKERFCLRAMHRQLCPFHEGGD